MRRRGDKRLQFAQNGPRAFDARKHNRSGGWFRAFAQKKGRWVCDLGKASAGHLKDANLIGRAKAVFNGAQNAELVAALAFEIKHRVDHMFDHAGACDLAFFGDMADKHDADALAFGKGGQLMGRRAHLTD